MDSTLEIMLLGQAAVSIDGEPVTGFSTTKTLALLCYLAATGKSHRREDLAALLWGAETPVKAHSSLRVALSSIKQLIGDFLDISAEKVGLRQDVAIWLDLEAFARRARAKPSAANVARLQAAADLYRADFMADCQIEDAAAFERWLLVEREHWRGVMLATLTKLAEAKVLLHDYAGAAATLRQQVYMAPWEEDAHRGLMVVYSRLGDFNRALAQFEECRQCLAVELDVEPAPETEELAARIHAARLLRPLDLPSDTTAFIARTGELAQLSAMLANPACRLITIVGFGGTGKTTLVMEAARQANQEHALQFLNGVYFVPLAEVTDPARLPLAIAAEVGLALSGRTEPLAELAAYLRTREMLLVLDNLEQLPAAPSLQYLLRAAPALKLLVTSRTPLELEEEWRLDLEGLPYTPEPGHRVGGSLMEALAQNPAAQLFLQHVYQVRSDFVLNEHTAPLVLQLCRAVEGMPLALVLAAPWLRAMSLERVVKEVERGLDVLTTRMRDLPERQRSMRAIFDSTWKLMSAEERTALSAIAVFAGSFDEQAAETVAAIAPSLLAQLYARGLLQLAPAPENTRYRLHELVRQYALGQQAQVGLDPVRLSLTHRHYFAATLCDRFDDLRWRRQQPVLHELDADRDNIRSAWLGAIQTNDWPALSKAQSGLLLYMEMRGLFREGEYLFEQALNTFQNSIGTDPIEPEQRRWLGQMLRGAAWSKLRVGQVALSQPLFERSAELMEAGSLDLAYTTVWLSISHLGGNYRRALEMALASHELYKAAGDLWGIAFSLTCAGLAAEWQGEYAAAEAYQQQAIPIFRTLQETRFIAFALTSLGRAHLWMGHYETAKENLEEAYRLRQECDDRYGLANSTLTLFYLQLAVGDFTAAAALADEGLARGHEICDERIIGFGHEALGYIQRVQGSLHKAQHHCEAALAAYTAAGDHSGVAICHRHLGQLAAARGDYAAAEEECRHSLVLYSELGTKRNIAVCLWQLAFVFIQAGRAAEQETAAALRDALYLAAAVQAWPVVLDTICIAALYFVRTNSLADQTVAALLHIVVNHSASTAENRRRAQDVLAEVAAAGDEAGQGTDLEEVVEQVSSWLALQVTAGA